MLLLKSIILAANAWSFAQSFTSPILLPASHQSSSTLLAPLHATPLEDAQRLLAKARELREAVKAGEDELHSSLIQKKKTRDAATDSIVAHLFRSEDGDDEDGGVGALCARLREKRLASVMLVQIVERLHAREIAAKGIEHVEASMHHENRDQVASFKRVSKSDEAELGKVQGLIDKLVVAAEVLDKEFHESHEVITHSDMMHWGGGDIAGIIKDKAKQLGREHDEQFQKRLESFYEAARRKVKRGDVNVDGDITYPGE